jgi:hypothetical protein
VIWCFSARNSFATDVLAHAVLILYDVYVCTGGLVGSMIYIHAELLKES